MVRGADGRFYVLEDNIRCPSGVSYVIENRRMMARIFPELFASHRVLPVNGYPAKLLEALRAAAPHGRQRSDGRGADPGRLQLGLLRALLPGPPDGRRAGRGPRPGLPVEVRSTCAPPSGEQRVDVVYRRVDDEFLDPLHFRPDSVVGCPGILNAARAGNVTIANAVGNGVADDKLTYTYMPEIIRYYLGEEPDPAQRRHLPPGGSGPAGSTCSAHLDELVLKPVGGVGGLRDHHRSPGERRGARARPALRWWPTRGRGSPRRSWPCRPRRPGSATAWPPATSICARSPSTTAGRSGSFPAV